MGDRTVRCLSGEAFQRIVILSVELILTIHDANEYTDIALEYRARFFPIVAGVLPWRATRSGETIGPCGSINVRRARRYAEKRGGLERVRTVDEPAPDWGELVVPGAYSLDPVSRSEERETRYRYVLYAISASQQIVPESMDIAGLRITAGKSDDRNARRP